MEHLYKIGIWHNYYSNISKVEHVRIQQQTGEIYVYTALAGQIAEHYTILYSINIGTQLYEVNSSLLKQGA